MIFPSLFDRFAWLASLRGAPAVYAVLLTALLVVDSDRRLVGALNIHDLFRAGVM